MKIYGAGLAGLIAGHMLRRFEPEIHELQLELPNNHEAVLRFRSEAVSVATGIPFRRVRVYKQVWYKNEAWVGPEMPSRITNQYSLKVTGQVLNRSIVNLAPVDRWIAPLDFVDQLSRGLDIHYHSLLSVYSLTQEGIKISTVPMPMLLGLMNAPKYFRNSKWPHRTTWNVVANIHSPPIDVYQTTYFPEDNFRFYRATLTGPRLSIEYIQEPKDMMEDVFFILTQAFGFGHFRVQEYRKHLMEYGKIAPVSESQRQGVIRLATERHHCYSLGRFATWRQILLDDIVNDVKVIERLIDADPYTRALVEAK